MKVKICSKQLRDNRFQLIPNEKNVLVKSIAQTLNLFHKKVRNKHKKNYKMQFFFAARPIDKS